MSKYTYENLPAVLKIGSARDIAERVCDTPFDFTRPDLEQALDFEIGKKTAARKTVIKAIEEAIEDHIKSEERNSLDDQIEYVDESDESDDESDKNAFTQNLNDYRKDGRKLSDSEKDTEDTLILLFGHTQANGPADVETFEKITGRSAGRHMAPYSWNLGIDGRQPSDRKPLFKAALRIGFQATIEGAAKNRTIDLTVLSTDQAEANRQTVKYARESYDAAKGDRKAARQLQAKLADEVSDEMDQMIDSAEVPEIKISIDRFKVADVTRIVEIISKGMEADASRIALKEGTVEDWLGFAKYAEGNADIYLDAANTKTLKSAAKHLGIDHSDKDRGQLVSLIEAAIN